jgi:hypothetical protein
LGEVESGAGWNMNKIKIKGIMKTIAEIEEKLPDLSTEDLYQIECEIHELYRKRNDRVIYDDAYGLWINDDQVSAASEVFVMFDKEEEQNGGC